MIRTQWIRCKQTATTCEHQYAVDEQVQLHDDIRLLSNVTATLNWDRGCVPVTVADKWNPVNVITYI